MSKDEITLKGKGYILQFILQGGGVKNFLLFILVVGVICFFFGLLINPLFAFGLFALIALATLVFLFYLASQPDGRIFFLDSNTYFRVIKLQMSLIGDHKTGRHELTPKTQFAQPILSTPGDAETDAKRNTMKVLGAKK